MSDLNEYLRSPCRASSIPFWKARAISVPPDMRILHQVDFADGEFEEYADEPYFRLLHDLLVLAAPVLPEGYSVCEASLGEFAAHIRSCYDSADITEDQLLEYTRHPVYDASLWVAVRCDRTGKVVATGIAELDSEIGEGVLEWIQVSSQYRRKGLGQFLVLELLQRMGNTAQFATVSGRCNNPSCPEALYRKCGFTGTDIWHILRKKTDI